MLSNILTLSTLASTALAIAIPWDSVPTRPQVPDVDDPFSIAVKGPSIDYKLIQAYDNHLWIGGEQKAKCANKPHPFATFSWDADKHISLWTNNQPPQGLWTDASGMGQGNTEYFTGKGDNLPSNALRGPYEIDSSTGHLTFKTIGTKACPSVGKKGVWQIWFTDLEKPASIEGCETVELYAFVQDDETFCEYGH